MADKKSEKYDQKIDVADLDEVSGGAIGDRMIATMWVARYYGSSGTHGQVIDTSNISNEGSVNSVMANFCAKAGIDYQMNETGKDLFKIDGEWRDMKWILKNNRSVLDYFDKKLGLK